MSLDPMLQQRPEPLLIFPCNGNGIEALDCLGTAHRFIGFIDDAPEKQGMKRHGHRILARTALNDSPDARLLAVPGNAASYQSRKQIIGSLGVKENRFTSVIHPFARISPLAIVGYNVLIMAGVVVTSNAVISNHVCILPNTVIHHDVVIGEWTLIGSNVTIAGSTVVGVNCYIGSGSSIMNGLQIGNGALVGLGSNVIRNVQPDATVAGNPARYLAGRPGSADREDRQQ
jgi:sugar O-acyltransferase (sialic acid O-acetyltransferase NeuD family)